MWSLLAAGEACLDDRVRDIHGHRIQLKPHGARGSKSQAVLAWSVGADGVPDSADDEVMLVANTACAERLRHRW